MKALRDEWSRYPAPENYDKLTDKVIKDFKKRTSWGPN